jgi:myo-inositol-1(or 4)-monophosphatase
LPERDERQTDEADTALLVESVRQAGGIARKFFGGTFKRWDKSKGNPVTEADIAIDRHLRDVLLRAEPGYGWLSEETEDDPSRLNRARVFVVDPIDGTHGFLKGRPHFTIVAAVVTNGRPVAAAIYNPITEEMYAATKGAGATRNGVAIEVSTTPELEGARMLAPRDTYEDPHWRKPLPADLTIENRASIAYRLALVAEGKFDAMVSLSTKSEWDVAAGDLLVQEAGGKVTTQTGASLVYNKIKPLQQDIIAAGPGLHGQLLDRLRKLDTER